MDISQSEEALNPIIAIEDTTRTSEELFQAREFSEDSPNAEHKESNSRESDLEKTEKVVHTTVESKEEILGEFAQAATAVIDSDIEKCTTKKSDQLSENAGDEMVEPAKKETIEILNVELVAPACRNLGIPVIDTLSQVNENNLTSRIFENIEENETNLKEIQLDETQVNNNQHLATFAVYNVTNNESFERSDCGTNRQGSVDDKISTSANVDIDAQESANQEHFQNVADVEEIEMDTTENRIVDDCNENNTEPVKTSGLSLLAQYQSDDDADSVIEIPITTTQDYRNQVVEIGSDSDSDDSSSSSEVECLNELRKTIEKRIEVVDEDDAEDEENEDNSGKRKPQQRLRVKGEMLLEDLPPIQDLQITVPEDHCIEFGKIHSIVDQLVLVSALPNSILLDLETVIFLEKGQKVLGEVFDVLGQVADPLYCVRFNSNTHIQEKHIQVGEVVYVAPKTQYTQYIILSSLMRTKGSDASWENDMEPPPKFLDYSDDEQEQLAKKQLRNKDRPTDNDDPSKKARTVDDDNDDSMSTSSSSYQSVPQHRNRYERRNNRGSPAGNSFVNNRPRYNAPPYQGQQRPSNHHRSSWHSNYYPQNFSSPPNNYRMHSPQNRAQAPQPYNPNMPAYGVPPAHNMQYPPPQPAPYGTTPMFQQHSAQLMPNTFSMRPPSFHGPPPPHIVHHQQHISNPPPPPGSQ